ncbi:sensor domain-containing protein [Streptomyces rimosus]|uniref:sensor histidine kinase n=1 Tax=Streptomyces rimosus TaxID=1927 RepID=UPI000B28E803|nr:sensor domain-containing protein [Streptomyces rimosus]
MLHAVTGLPFALLGMALVVGGLLVSTVLAWTALGPWLMALTVRGASALGGAQRALARGLLAVDVEAPARRTGGGPLGWRRAVLGDRAGWRATGCALLAPFTAVAPLLVVLMTYVYGLLFLAHPLLKHINYFTEHGPDGSERHVSLQVNGVEFDSWPRWLLVVATGAVLLLAAPWLLRQAQAPHRFLVRALLGPDPSAQRIRTLEETRAHAVEDAAATLRRIERDLHDGTQARLVGLGMHLTMIREMIGAGADRDQLLAVVETAQGNAKQAVADLRHLVRGIHPPVLDQGLDAALATLAADSALPVTLTTGAATRRPSPAVESLVYFCAAELLANAVKHSGASGVAMELSSGPDADGDAVTAARGGRGKRAANASPGELRLTVRDDGRGGAVIGAGSGLTGLRDRARTVDATLTCDSPPGGPTVVTVRVPLA